MPLAIRYKPLVVRKGTAPAYTLIELMVIVIILGILAGLSVPLYVRSIEKTYNKQVFALMKMMLEAEKMYRLKTGSFVACDNSDACSSELRLSLPQDKWLYRVIEGVPQWKMRVERIPSGRVFELSFDASTSTDEKPTCSGGNYCP